MTVLKTKQNSKLSHRATSASFDNVMKRCFDFAGAWQWSRQMILFRWTSRISNFEFWLCLFEFAVPTAMILGGPDLHVGRGSTINLTCLLRFSPNPPDYIFWYHKDEVSLLFYILFVFSIFDLSGCMYNVIVFELLLLRPELIFEMSSFI